KYSLIEEVAQTEVVVPALGTPRKSHVMACYSTCAVQQVLPIGIHVFSLVQSERIKASGFPTFEEYGSVHHGVLAEHLLRAVETIVCQPGLFAFLTLVGSYQDDAVGTARSVNGSGGCIFQNVDALDVVRIDVGDGTDKRNTVEHDQRIVAGCQRPCASNADLHSCTGL